MVGIWGAGGIGKSTIARAVYNSVADNFEALCFLSNVRKQSKVPNGLSHLQETLLCKLVMEKDLKLGDYHEGIPIIEHRLSQKKILLILDDVDDSNQLKALAGSCNWFGCGSRIIITTRNKQLLVSHDVKSIYGVKELNDKESLSLLSWFAFKNENVDSNYVGVCSRAVDYACGFPLALEVVGSNLGDKGVNLWRSALHQFKSTPDERVLDALKLSYDTLGKVEKQVFLDLACFFNGGKLADVIDILLNVRAIQPEYAIDTLIDKSLVKIEQDRVTMHDLIEDIGKEIVRQESPNEPGEQSRLWFYEDILHVLQQDTGTSKVEAIILDLPENVEVQWCGEEFMKMKNLKMLVIRKACFSECPKYLPNGLRWVEWKGYPFKLLPYMHPNQLVYLDLSYSSCELLQPFDKKFPNLSHMNFRNCKFVQQIPDLSGAFNLKELWLDGCPNLIEIHDSIGSLNALRELSAMRCKNLKVLPSCLRSRSLKHLNLFGCLSLQRFPEISVIMNEMQTLDLDKTAITELPSSICNLLGLETLNVEECPRLKELPASIFTLPNLWKLTANFCEGQSHFKTSEGGDEASLDCSEMSLKMEQLYLSNCNLSDDSLAFCLSHFTNMIHLDLSFNNFTILPECIKEYHNLKYLLLDYCNHLQHIGGMPPSLDKFSAICCTSLTKLSKSKVLKQALNIQSEKRNILLPGKILPKRLHYYSQGSSVSFWVRNVFPSTSLWILVKNDQDHLDNCKFSVYINDTKVNIISSLWLLLSTIMTYHIYMCDMQSIILSTELPWATKWNQVKVSIETQEVKGPKEIYLGVRVYNLQSNSENIRFMDPRRYIIDDNLLQKVRDQRDWGELEEDVNLDLISTKHAESLDNPMFYQERGIMKKLRPFWSLEVLKVSDRSYHYLIELHQINCKNCMRFPPLGQLPALKSLTIEGLESVVAIGSEFFNADDCASAIAFPSLETLYFEHMISWEEWNSIDMEVFPKLRTLRFHDCPKLIGNLPPQLVSLECLEIEGCPLLASSIPKYPKIHHLLMIKSPSLVLQEQELPLSLHSLTISGTLMLEPLFEKLSIEVLSVRDYSDAVIHMPPSVKELRIAHCENVKFVLVSKAPLYHLRRISIYNCKFLRTLFDEMERLVPYLQELFIKGCPELEPFSKGSLPSRLDRLEIRECDKLLSRLTELHHLPNIIQISRYAWGTSHCRGLEHLTFLQVLQILDNSFDIENIEGDMMPPCLQRLHICDYGFLLGQFRDKDEDIWPEITEKSVRNKYGNEAPHLLSLMQHSNAVRFPSPLRQFLTSSQEAVTQDAPDEANEIGLEYVLRGPLKMHENSGRVRGVGFRVNQTSYFRRHRRSNKSEFSQLKQYVEGLKQQMLEEQKKFCKQQQLREQQWVEQQYLHDRQWAENFKQLHEQIQSLMQHGTISRSDSPSVKENFSFMPKFPIPVGKSRCKLHLEPSFKQAVAVDDICQNQLATIDMLCK